MINRGRKCFGMPKDSASVSAVGAAEVFCEFLILRKMLEPIRPLSRTVASRESYQFSYSWYIFSCMMSYVDIYIQHSLLLWRHLLSRPVQSLRHGHHYYHQPRCRSYALLGFWELSSDGFRN